MSTLPKDLRSKIEKAVLAAREEATEGARVALTALGVGDAKKPSHLDAAGEKLRRRLRARGRQAGDQLKPDDSQETEHLVQECAYEHWHRMLFARFLAENELLRHPEMGVSVSLEECEELARDEGLDLWELAARFAQHMLPEVFRQDDPVLQLRLPTEARNKLTAILNELPTEVFTAEDSLGWTYQFWQTRRKKEVNESGNKIGADEISPVTQLFTEDYMVDFLLDNTLGAWHAGKVLAANPTLAESAGSEDELRKAVALPGCPWNYLRFVQGSTGVSPVNAGDHAPFFDPYREIEIHERNLPHWQQGAAWVFVTWRLADSLPAGKLAQWREQKEVWLQHHPEPWDATTTQEFHETFSEPMDAWLDSGMGACVLAQPHIRKIVVDALSYFDGQRYELGDYVVMPNHVHVLLRPGADHALADILHSWKSFTSKEINRALGRSGTLWQEEYWDRLVRHEKHLAACRRYIAENPAKAGLAPDAYSHRSTGILPVSAPTHGRDARAPLNPPAWTPAAGNFDGWPATAAELTCLDPCMGSGHFVVAMFQRLVALRVAEEGLDEAAAVAAVIRDNLFGLEIDPRCTQIAAFNLALAAWRRVGHCPLPAMNLACSGLAPNAPKDSWINLGALLTEDSPLAGERDLLGPSGEPMLLDARLAAGMAQLHDLFQKAPVLGSLINPRAAEGDLLLAAFHELQPLLEKALAMETKDDNAHEMAVTAHGLAKAAEILAGEFTLVTTNVPFLGRGKQGDLLKDYCEAIHPDAKADLATCFLERCLNSCIAGGTTALITPQNWWFLPSYLRFRSDFLKEHKVRLAATLGEEAWQSFGHRGPVTILLVADRSAPLQSHTMFGIDALPKPTINFKTQELRHGDISALNQSRQMQNPDCRIMLAEPGTTELLVTRATSFQGIKTGDDDRVRRFVWEFPRAASGWRFFQGSVESTREFGGLDGLLKWGDGGDGLARRQGMGAWDKRGVMVSQMRELAVALYLGESFDSNASPIVPRDESELMAIWVFCHSPSYAELVRKVDHSLKPTNKSLVQVPFDLAHWQKVAAEKYPNGLPKPYSSDPTQWLFHGHPKDSDQALHVAVARLLGYRWPRQTGSSFPDCPALGPDGLEGFADDDGIVCLNPVRGEDKAADRLREILRSALGNYDERTLLTAAGKKGSKSTTLEDWMRDEFFEQHCDLFHQRPFLWHLWDGRKDGFHAIVNYHRLAAPNGAGRRTLEALTHGYLGDWITRQRAAVAQNQAGADDRLAAALELHGLLENILAGEPPHDLFIRWKPLHRQPIGWEPDINDGVRLNARPFLATDLSRGRKGAGVLRWKPNIKWGPNADRGTEPERPKEDFPWFWSWDERAEDFAGGIKFDGKRWNDLHYTTTFKQAARERNKKGATK